MRWRALVQFYYLALFLDPGRAHRFFSLTLSRVFLPVLGYFTISSLAEKFSFRWAMLYLP